jgi:glutathione S-transferase
MTVKLYHSPASPYARKVRSVIEEKDLTALVEQIVTDTSATPAELVAANPLGKIPALINDEGFALFDSPVICAYLDAHPAGKAAPLIPAAAPDRWQVMRGEAFGDGLMDLGLYLIDEKRKPEGEKSPTLTARRRGQIERSLDAASGLLGELPQAFNVGHIAIACALGYFDFRHDDIGWRNGRDQLAAWYGENSRRPCLAATAPV